MPENNSFRDRLNERLLAGSLSPAELEAARGSSRLVTHVEVPARSGGAVRVRAGQVVRVVNVEGRQIGDLFAFSSQTDEERLSPSETRNFTFRSFPRIGQAFWSSARRPMLTLIEDHSPGDHDMMFHACSREFYEVLCGDRNHRNCRDNYYEAVKGLLGRTVPICEPVNLFQNTSLERGEFLLPANSAAAGDFVKLRAEMNLVCVLTSCSWDLEDQQNRCNPLRIEVLE